MQGDYLPTWSFNASSVALGIMQDVTRVSPPRISQAESWSRTDRATAELLVALFAWALTALGFALVGWFHWWLVVPTSLALWLAMRKVLPQGAGKGGSASLVAVVLIASLGIINGLFPGEHLFTGRDSGTYLATAGWLADSGSLYVDARSGPLGEREELEFEVPGFYDLREDGVLEPQFMHAYPAMLATIIDLVDVGAALRLTAAIGAAMLLALFALAKRWMNDWLAVVVVLTVGLGLVFTYFSRAPFSELLAATFMIGGLWLLGMSEDRLDSRLGLLAGALLGGMTLIRLDGIVLLLPVTAYLSVRSLSEPEIAPLLRRVRLSMVVVAAVGLGESLLISPGYVIGRRGMVLPVLISWLLLLVFADVLPRATPLRRTVVSNRRRLFWFGVAVAGTLLAYAWLIRPHVSEPTGITYGLPALQIEEGVEVDPDRSYAELSVQWLTWYHGAGFVILGFLGSVVMVARSIFTRKAPNPTWLVPGVLATFAALYLWRPSINPDQIWAMRRFLTVVIPLGALSAGVAIDEIVRRTMRNGQPKPAARLLAALLSIVLIAPPLVATAPVWDVHEFPGLAEDFQTLCDDLGPSAHVLVMDGGYGELGHRLTQSFRSYCGAHSAWNGDKLAEEVLADLDQAVASDGGSLVIVSATGSESDSHLRGPYTYLDVTLTRPTQSETLTEPTIYASPYSG